MIKTLVDSFEKEVYAAISKCLNKNEKIEFNKYFDFFLPNGVETLGWKENTFIEVKYRLMYDSFSRIRITYDRIHTSPKNLIVIYYEGTMPTLHFHETTLLPSRMIKILSYMDFQQKVDAIHSRHENQDVNFNKDLFIKGNEESAVEKAKDAIKNDRISLFLGAGVSMSAGLVNWSDLLEQLSTKRGLNSIQNKYFIVDEIIKGRRIIDSYEQAEKHKKKEELKKLKNEIRQESNIQKEKWFSKLYKYISQDKALPNEFYNDMRDILYANNKPKKELIESIVELIKNTQVESVITYNYDDLVEQEIKKSNNNAYSVYEKSRPIDANTVHVYHVHGFIPQKGLWSPIVLGEKEYHKIYQDSYNWSNVEQLHALNSSTCFFIGLSMTDPNLRRLLDISKDGGEEEAVHYIFLCRTEFDVPFMENTMRSFGINCIWYDNHNDLPGLLKSLM